MKTIESMSDDELENVLLTCDGDGKDAKRKALDELKERAYNDGLKFGSKYE